MKNYITVFVIATLLISTSGTLLLMLMMPQTNIDTSGKIDEYQSINREEYKFENTKNITDEKSERIYKITDDSLKSFKKKYMYKPGNVNPFSSEVDVYNEWVENNQNNNIDDKTDNSNNGQNNSSHTNK